MKKKLVPVIKQEEGNLVPVEVLAQEIANISKGVKKLLSGPLNKKCLYLLIQNSSPMVRGGSYRSKTKVGMTEIKAVIEGLESLEREYLK